MKIKRETIEAEEEKRILISSIVSTEFLKQIEPIAKPNLFNIPFSKRVYQWITDYYEKYGEAPGKTIQSIYEVERERLHEDEAELIGIFLESLSDRYEDSINEPFNFDRAIRYLRKQAMLAHSKKIQALLDLNKIDEAEQEWSNFRKVSKLTSSCVNPHDPEYIKRIMTHEEDVLLQFPGAVGDLFGPWGRGWLVAVQAGYNVGKTFALQEVRLLALTQRLKVFEVNLEMSDKRLTKRHLKRITALAEHGGVFRYPVYDCLFNQINDCDKRERTGRIALYDPEKQEKPSKPEEQPKGYKVCSYCRNDHELKKRFYKPEVWYINLKKEPMSPEVAVKKAKAMDKMYGNNYRLRCYPRFSANIKDVERELDILEYSEGFVPDVIIIDYADILAPEDSRIINDEQRKNDTWMTLAKIAGERHCLVATATQIKTGALGRKRGKMGDASGSARAVYGHTDFVWAISQTEEEKQADVVRFNVIKHREGEFIESQEVQVLQQLSLGQALIDSEFVSIKKEGDK